MSRHHQPCGFESFNVKLGDNISPTKKKPNNLFVVFLQYVAQIHTAILFKASWRSLWQHCSKIDSRWETSEKSRTIVYLIMQFSPPSKNASPFLPNLQQVSHALKMSTAIDMHATYRIMNTAAALIIFTGFDVQWTSCGQFTAGSV